ncbi:9608_t:CDS:1, partial [Cetraspora pellucida]
IPEDLELLFETLNLTSNLTSISDSDNSKKIENDKSKLNSNSSNEDITKEELEEVIQQ